MARFYDPTPEQEAGWLAWVAERPPAVRAVAERLDPWSLYRMKSTGHCVSVHSLSEGPPVTLTVNVTADYNLVLFERQVFGIDPADLEPCDLPSPEDVTGAAMTRDEVTENLDELRVLARPDLWEMGTDGKARRKDN